MDYYIDTPEDLTNILGACIRKNRTRGCRFVIRKDLDCGIITNFAPLGNGSRYSFDGELDGADHVIRNLEICPRQTYDLGFFARIGTGAVKNLWFEAARVRQDISGVRSGAKTTRAGILAAVCQGTIENCSAQGTIVLQTGAGACAALSPMRNHRSAAPGQMQVSRFRQTGQRTAKTILSAWPGG